MDDFLRRGVGRRAPRLRGPAPPVPDRHRRRRRPPDRAGRGARPARRARGRSARGRSTTTRSTRARSRTRRRSRTGIVGLGYTDVSDVKDRGYFHSVYMRTPGGALFELAAATRRASPSTSPRTSSAPTCASRRTGRTGAAEIAQLEPIDTIERSWLNPHLAAPPVRVGRALARARRVAVVVHGRGQEPGVHARAPRRAHRRSRRRLRAAGGVGAARGTRGATTSRGSRTSRALGQALEAVRGGDRRACSRPACRPERIVLAGFSQGACLRRRPRSRRRPRPYAGVGVADRRADRSGG